MAEVFLSYASEDRARVRPLAEALQARGFDVWWDRALGAGQDYTAVIEQELRAAKAVIVVWTQASAASTFVRDEAGRARDDGRLIPVLLDPVQIPLGFGAYQAEDFTRWNGQAGAAQMQILGEALQAKLEGRAIDGGAVARKRQRLMSRIRIVSLLSVVALLVVIAVGTKSFLAPPPPDLRAELLRLLAEGQLTPEQAIQLAGLLEAGALGQAPQNLLASGEAPSPAVAPEELASSGVGSRALDADPGIAQPVAVSETEFDAAARGAYRRAFLAVAQHPDEQVRLALVQMAQTESREAAMQSLWAYAQNHPDDPLRDEIYLLYGAVGERNADPLGQRALEIAANLSPRDSDVWRMLSRSYARAGRAQEAEAAALIGDGVEAWAQGNTDLAEQLIDQASPVLDASELPVAGLSEQLSAQASPNSAAPVESELGETAPSEDE